MLQRHRCSQRPFFEWFGLPAIGALTLQEK
jgi:hypothetical protein